MKTFEVNNQIIKEGDKIRFNTCSYIDEKKTEGIVSFREQLGFITIVNGIQYLLVRLLNIEKVI